jgi:NADPH:quinone reductase-like Zn-dependent oxidoreductase
MKAVRFDRFGDESVLQVCDVEDPVPAAGEALVRVKAAAINPGEIYIREGLTEQMWPTALPCGQGTDFAGIVEQIGTGVDVVRPGDEVIGWSNARSAHAELVVAPVAQLIAKPAQLSWEVAGSMYIAPTAALASVEAVDPKAGETVAVSGATGGVGVVAVQLCRRIGARVLGIAGPTNRQWLSDHGAYAIEYGPGLAERIRDAVDSRPGEGVGGRLDAMIDLFGGGYAEVALELGVPKARINTIIDIGAVMSHGVGFKGTDDAGNAENVAHLVDLVATGELEIPISATYPLADVADAYRQLAQRHTLGKIVLIP